MAEGRKTQNSAEDVVRITLIKCMSASGVHLPWSRMVPAPSFNQSRHQATEKRRHALLKAGARSSTPRDGACTIEQGASVPPVPPAAGAAATAVAPAAAPAPLGRRPPR